ncbi:MAG: EamA family transporter [Saprospiraceae bacterium]|nr:EamA family transporter [Saprospiraceae bacterium]
MSSETHVSPRDWWVLTLLTVIWGSSFILIKKSLIGFDPVEVAVLRISISTIAFIPIYFLLFRYPVPRNKIGWVALIGILGNGLPAFAYAIAQTHVDSSVAGILNSLTPIFTWLFGLFLFAVAFKPNQLVGVTIGFIGAVLIVGLDPNLQFRIDTFSLLIVFGTICYGIAGNIVKSKLQDVHPIALSAVAFFCMGFLAIGYSFTTDIYSTVIASHQVRMSLLAVSALALVGTVFANIFFFRLIQSTNAVFGSSVAYLIPIMALIWGILDGERVAWTHLAGMALIISGVYVMRK